MSPTTMSPIDWTEVAASAYAAYSDVLPGLGNKTLPFSLLSPAVQAAWEAAARAVGKSLNFRM